MRPYQGTRVVLMCCILLFMTACVWNWNWTNREATRPASEAAEHLQRAQTLMAEADDQEEVEAAIAEFESVFDADPENERALTLASNLHLLLGDAYSHTRAEKKAHFKSALALSEAAMCTNPEFKRLLAEGEHVWDACRVLGHDEIEAMAFWTTGVFYLFKEGQGPLGQMLNFRWMGRALKVLERMREIDPDWGGGYVSFSLGLYYLGVPESVGGDRQESARLFEQAISTGPDWIINRWGRARYFHIKMKNRDAFIEDMRWVLEQDPHAGGSPYAWNAYFQRDARRGLEHIDELF